MAIIHPGRARIDAIVVVFVHDCGDRELCLSWLPPQRAVIYFDQLASSLEFVPSEILQYLVHPSHEEALQLKIDP